MQRMHKAFTLVELVVVVAIIGILAAIAVPQMRTFSLKAKRAELHTVMSGMSRSAAEWLMDNEGWLLLPWNPPSRLSSLNKGKERFQPDYKEWGDLTGLTQGEVYCAYYGYVLPSSSTYPQGLGIFLSYCDMDRDGKRALYYWFHDPSGYYKRWGYPHHQLYQYNVGSYYDDF